MSRKVNFSLYNSPIPNIRIANMSDEVKGSSALFEIYHDELKEEETTEIYEELPSNISKSPKQIRTINTRKQHSLEKIGTWIAKLLLLGILGILYHQLSSNIHDNHILTPNLASKPLNIGVQVSKFLIRYELPEFFIYAVEGIFFGSILPLFDHFFASTDLENGSIFYSPSTASLLSSPSSTTPVNPNKKGSSSSTIIRTLIAFLGIAFAFRKIEWTSSFQAALAWTLLTPVLWVLLDGSIIGFTIATSIASIASFSVVLNDGIPVNWATDLEFWAVMLWLGNFFFFGLLIFGKIGRFLFN